MRKHVEDSAALPRKYWNILFEIAILLLPFGLLVAWWGAYWLGLGIQIIGLLMMPPLWIARHRLFGMSKEDMKNSLIGWALFVGSAVLRAVMLGNHWGSLAASIMSIIGLLMIYSHGVYLERGTRFWLVIFLYIGIPIYIYGSSFLGQLNEAGVFATVQPFGFDYRIAAVTFGEVPEKMQVIELDHRNGLHIGSDRIWGQFEYAQPGGYQGENISGSWYLAPEQGPADHTRIPGALYRLDVTTDEKTILSCLEDDQLQWRWELKQIPKVWFALNNTELTVVWNMDWFYSGTYPDDPATVQSSTHSGEGTAHIECRVPDITELTVKEEYHHGDHIEYREYVLVKDKNDHFPLPDAVEKQYEDEDQYILYRVQWEGGEYLFCLKLE